ncbi:MAG: NAD(+)/NADH kinase [Spirochaetaceae bacterium]|nr:NAD(+)/NADH kinase [Spirochaetaceae bacterium]
MNVLLVVNPQKPSAQTLAREIEETLNKKNVSSAVISYTTNAGIQQNFDVAFSLGGDGTVLFTARVAASFGVPILPVNLGTLGFIATINPDKWESVFEDWRSNAETAVSHRLMLDVRVERDSRCVFKAAALNDAVVSASGIAKAIRLSAQTSGVNLASYRSDGLIVATPTGSTAYSAAAGGPILDPEMEAVILNPICPFTMLHRPIVTPADETITINIEQEQRSGVLLTIDGQVTEELKTGDVIFIKKAPYKAKLLFSGKKAFYKALHSKLNYKAI